MVEVSPPALSVPVPTETLPVALVVSYAPPDRTYPNGFSPRLVHFIEALSTRMTVDLAVFAAEGELAPAEELPVRELYRLPRPVLSLSAWSVLGRLGRRLFDPIPLSSTPRSVPPEVMRLLEARPAVFVVHMPPLTHFALRAPPGVLVVLAIEEDWTPDTRARLRSGKWPSLRLALLRLEQLHAHRMRKRAGARAAEVIAISDTEAKAFESVMHRAVEVVPHGIDLAYFAPSGAATPHDFDVLFVGDLGQARNREPVLELVRAAVAHPDPVVNQARWCLVGRDAGKLALPPRARVTIVENAEDVRPFYENSATVVVPSRDVSGVKTTLLQAWAMGRPVVVAAQSTSGVRGVDRQNVLITNSSAEMLASVRDLLVNVHLRERLGRNGRATAERDHDVVALAERFADLCASHVTER